MSHLVAHRGQKFSYPENTLESIAEAIRCGAPAVEFDVQLTRDQVAVVCHDITLSRTAGVDIDISRTDYDAIKNICVGEPARFGDKFQGATLPGLQAMINLLMNSPQVTAFVELKDESIDVFGIDAVIESVIPQLQQIRQQCVVIADNLQVLLAMRQRITVPIGWIVHNWRDSNLQLAAQNRIDYLIINQKYCANTQHDFTADSWQWMMYETSDPAMAVALFEQGIELVETDNICAMLRQLTADKYGQL